MITNPSTLPATRFVFVDGLRGFAALGIVVFHLWWYEPEPVAALQSAHWVFDELLFRIRVGVQILLVISGFVIAYTLRNTWVTPREFVSFVSRRLVRLIPTYWVAIAAVILVDTACRELWDLSSPFDGELSWWRIWAHMTFLQDVFGHEALSAGMWTICIEMQFYITAVLGWGIAQRAFTRPIVEKPRPSSFAIMVVFAPVALVSLFHWRTLESTEPWVIHFTWMFFLGMATWWTLDGTLTRGRYWGIVTIAIVNLCYDGDWRYENSMALATSLAIYFAGRRDALHRWLNWNWLQYLGRISYSLYLIHFSVCHLLTTAGWKYFGNTPTSVQASLVLLLSLAASIVAAHGLYVLVEAPSAGWAAKMKQASARSG